MLKANVYGNISDRAFVIVTVSFFLLLYIRRNPINITKYVNNGVIPFTELSAALKTAWANSGVNELCINIGIIIGAMIAHFVDATGTTKVDISVKMKVMITSTIPVNCILLIKLVSDDTINIPILVCLNIRQNCAAKNINTSSEDKSFR